ncbi:conglutin beta 5-like [Papaver somniferum]|uniref:conglutin beta 5-like n=1 Tax=Papaver somniferum TaxID=3469 RepID=UPI000E6F86E5|nr:conglutin beta 5-like [Papaver somniferum]
MAKVVSRAENVIAARRNRRIARSRGGEIGETSTMGERIHQAQHVQPQIQCVQEGNDVNRNIYDEVSVDTTDTDTVEENGESTPEQGPILENEENMTIGEFSQRIVEERRRENRNEQGSEYEGRMAGLRERRGRPHRNRHRRTERVEKNNEVEDLTSDDTRRERRRQRREDAEEREFQEALCRSRQEHRAREASLNRPMQQEEDQRINRTILRELEVMR